MEFEGIKSKLSLTGAVRFDERRVQMEMDFSDIEGASRKEMEAAREAAGFPDRALSGCPRPCTSAPPRSPRSCRTAKRWVKIDKDALGRSNSPASSSCQAPTRSNPAEMLRFLRRRRRRQGDRRPDRPRDEDDEVPRAGRPAQGGVELRGTRNERDEVRKTIERVAKQQGGYTFPGDGVHRRRRARSGARSWGWASRSCSTKEKVAGSIVIDLHDIGQGVPGRRAARGRDRGHRRRVFA